MCTDYTQKKPTQADINNNKYWKSNVGNYRLKSITWNFYKEALFKHAHSVRQTVTNMMYLTFCLKFGYPASEECRTFVNT